MARFVRATVGFPASEVTSVAPVPFVAPSNMRVPFYFASLLLFIHFGRLFDTLWVGYKIPLIVGGTCFLLVLFTGLPFLRSPVGKVFICLIVWMCITAPFSSWKGGTFGYVVSYVQNFAPLMLIVAVASKTPKDLVKLTGVLVFSVLFHLAMSGGESAGRYAMKGTFGNPDEVALVAGFLMPFMVLLCGWLRNPILSYPLMIGGCGYLLVTVGRTGTRAAIPAMIAMVAVYFFRGKGLQKIATVAMSCIAMVVVIAFLPAATRTRLSTVVDAFDAEDHYDGSEAAASAIERKEIMRDGIKATIQHPIFGVGAGMFTQYRFDHYLRVNGMHKTYMPAHNTFVEIMSETGIPGVILYLVFLGTIYSQIRASRKLTLGRTSEQANFIRSIALALEAALVYFVVCAVFMTCDRYPHQFVLAGFVIAMQKMGSYLNEGTPLSSVPSAAPGQVLTVPVVRKGSFPVVAR